MKRTTFLFFLFFTSIAFSETITGIGQNVGDIDFKFELEFDERDKPPSDKWSNSDLSAIESIGTIKIYNASDSDDFREYPFYITRYSDGKKYSMTGFWISYGQPNTLRIDLWEEGKPFYMYVISDHPERSYTGQITNIEK